MATLFYEEGAGDRMTVLRAIIALDAAACVLAFALWPMIWPMIEPTASWALGPMFATSSPYRVEFPQGLIWIAPGACAGLGWMLLQMRARKLAWPVALLPGVYVAVLYVASLMAGLP